MPSRKVHSRFEFPLAGLDRAHAFRHQPPYTTYALLNVRGKETIEGRGRGGQRPGLGKGFPEELGGGVDVRLLAQVTNVGLHAGGYFFYWGDDFFRDGNDLGTGWEEATWTVAPVIEPPTKMLIGGILTERPTSDAVHESLDYSIAFPYQLEMRIVPWNGQHWGTYRMFARMDDGTPDVTDEGVALNFAITGATGAWSGSLDSYSGGVRTQHALTGGNMGAAGAGWLRMLVEGVRVRVYWNAVEILDCNVDAHTGKRVGLGMETIGHYPTGLCLIDVFRVQGAPEGGLGEQRKRTYLVTSANHVVYADRVIGNLTEVTGVHANLSADHLVLATERNQLLYIADYDVPRVLGTDGVIDATGLQLTAPGVDDWRAYGIDLNTDVVVLSHSLGAAEDGTYQIATVTAAMVTLAASAGAGGTCYYRIERAPKIYDPATNEVTLWMAAAGLGQVPTGCPLICTYRDCVVLAGPDYSPHNWFMPRVGNPLDFDYFPEDPNDPGRAISGQNSDAGLIGDNITALIPVSDDYLLFGCKGSLWVMRGHPAFGGTIDALSYTVGILDKRAWAKGPSGELIFLSSGGLYMLGPGANTYPEPLSKQKLPDDLSHLNPLTHEILLVWNEKQHGVHIYIVPKTPVGYEAASPLPSASPSPSPEPSEPV